MKIIALYLPQFHRVKENDLWWGEGFTEWTNTKKAKPLFNNHNQPREPLNDNYYDLTNPLAREWQANVAKKYGVYGFCYYHYWFKGKRLLEKPFDEVLKSGEPDFPFCLSWANEPWTRAWDGGDKEVLMPQDYGDRQDWKEHFEYLLTAFQDKRYIRVNNKPLFLIYRPQSISRCTEMLNYWNLLSLENGLDGIYFVQTLNGFAKTEDHIPGFEAEFEFEPMFTLQHKISFFRKLRRKCFHTIKKILEVTGFETSKLVLAANYDLLWKNIVSRERGSVKKRFLGAFIDWDNSPRKGHKGLVVKGASPKKFGYYIQKQIANAERLGSEFIFINAWNEWAEGTYLEPDKKHGFEYLEELYNSIKKSVGK